MEDALSKLKEAAKIRSDMAKQEALFWEKIADALGSYTGSRNTFEEAREKHFVAPSTQPRKSGYLKNSDAAEYLGLSEGTLNKWRVTGEGPKFVKVGRAVRYKAEDLDGFVMENTFPHTSAYGLKK